MSKPADISQEVWDAAEDCFGDAVSGDWIAWLSDDEIYNGKELIARAIVAAVSSEREACAGAASSFATKRQAMIAVEYAVNSKFHDGATVDEFAPVIADAIAGAIRSRSTIQAGE